MVKPKMSPYNLLKGKTPGQILRIRITAKLKGEVRYSISGDEKFLVRMMSLTAVSGQDHVGGFNSKKASSVP